MRKTRIIIADDQTLMRDGLTTIFELEDDMEVVGTADNGERAWELAKEVKPDLVLLDIRMPGMNGIDSLRRIRADVPETMVVMLTTFDEEAYIIEALSDGAAGFLVKDMQGDQLIDAVRAVVKGQFMLPGTVATKLVRHLSAQVNEMAERIRIDRLKMDGDSFTERETEIIRLILLGSNNRKIAEALDIGEGTVRNYISVIYHKIGVNDRIEAIRRLSLLFPEEV